MESTAIQPGGWCVPAAYGKACTACSRAKCKCFYKPGGSVCERCDRLHRPCQPSASTRKPRSGKRAKRKAAEIAGVPAGVPLDRHQARQRPPTFTVIEEKIDDLMSLLRSQSQAADATETTGMALRGRHADVDRPPQPQHQPDVLVDKSAGVVHVVQREPPQRSPPALPLPSSASPVSPSSPSPASAAVLADVAAHALPDEDARHQLATFRRAFLTMFPFVHIPESVTASALRRDKPFLWLVIACLTARRIQDQFAMEETIWKIIGQRVVVEHCRDVDLLHGLVCFASWSYYFKQDRPFMTTITQLAVAMAFDLDLQQNPSCKGRKPNQVAPGSGSVQQVRSLEERRLFLAVFHLTSATWMAYRKTEPLRWTNYMDECMYTLDDAKETPLDALLQTQIRCQIMMNQLSTFPWQGQDSGLDGHVVRETHPPALLAAMLRQLGTMRSGKTGDAVIDRTTEFYLLATELTIREASVNKGVGQQPSQARRLRQHAATRAAHAAAHRPRCGAIECFQRVQELETLLACTWRWLDLLLGMALRDWAGVSVDHFSQLLHCLVVLFRLSTLSSTLSSTLPDEPDHLDVDDACATLAGDGNTTATPSSMTGSTAGSMTSSVASSMASSMPTGLNNSFLAEKPDKPDMAAVVEDMRRRADVLATIDRIADAIQQVPMAAGMVDAPGQRRGLFFKSALLFHAIKAFMASEMASSTPLSADKASLPPSRLGTLFSLDASADASEAVRVQDGAEENNGLVSQLPEAASFTAGTHYGVNAAVSENTMQFDGNLQLDLSDEPWLSDIFSTQWDLGIEEPGWA